MREFLLGGNLEGIQMNRAHSSTFGVASRVGRLSGSMGKSTENLGDQTWKIEGGKRKTQIRGKLLEGRTTRWRKFSVNFVSLRRFDRFPLAARLGFEPRQAESESAVLPLHHQAVEMKK
jgi:hypothetical protein